ncbi:FG-GAP repeat domain-containing protein [Nubsella zeaxanthinifaciens]|uniref:FG-GAP repeat domain-containing protein n=1 Tax=Nubsella zeaxanthinifaciens TaxID=392412 RepID=UPI000DE2FC25|nr:VCBS repeat-containing protein [Nubsella zeaxanthinifaciens]
MRKIVFLTALIYAEVFAVNAQTSFLKSGEPIKNGAPNGIGNLALPSLTGAVMGTAKVNDDDYPDLFMQADIRQPGTFLYYFKELTAAGEPVFSQGIQLKLPFEDTGENKASIIQTTNQDIYGFWRFGGKLLKMAVLNKKNNAFENLQTINVNGLPTGFTSFGVVAFQNKYLFLFTVAKALKDNVKMAVDSVYYTPEGFWPNELAEVGIYGAFVDDITKIKALDAKPLTELDQTYFGISGYTDYTIDGKQYVLSGTRLGNMHAYQIHHNGLDLHSYVVDQYAILQRSPSVGSYLAHFKIPGKTEGIFVSGEGSIVYYPSANKLDAKGNLVFGNPLAVKQQSPLLHGGSLVVPSLADWDGDGLIDLISGNSAGKILFFKNAGTNQNPAYQDAVALKAGGEEIQIQPGYREDIQGPHEARWGYVCPVVYDWNGDGLPDILTGDSRGKFMVFINVGTKGNPKLAVEKPLFVKGLNLHGGWRSVPGVANMAGKDAYVILDRDNQFHLYYKIDAYNVSDAGKLKLTDGSYINGHRRKGGQYGRAKTQIVDWDGDGVKDLLIGTGRGASIPNPINGLPYNRKKKNEGAAVLFLKNAGSDENPIFEFPKMMKFKGKDILLGAHECAPAAAYIGGDGKSLNLVVGTEYGTYMFYDRKDLSW